jgi:hypothetical protein
MHVVNKIAALATAPICWMIAADLCIDRRD